ncbi:MAG: cation efflux family transporter [Lysobacterales bacterium CG17_big_fil_post_rev_8_21_14_2_50_64_11]|nr:MAG: cation efflux family transporter [Xanthomonadales bacterium CG17_big_fil_post_rev_8_21_14_2_50_64_11]PIX59369.1 MAG: cation efflux family transporter [Xanthomonadales bacterium CG_4_10_14_3_um_filter_64_11]
MAAKADSTRTIFFALGANFAIFLAKGIAALLSGSGAMLAEAVHSLADTGNQGLLLLGMHRAKRPPSPDYPLGFGKEIYFWSFLVAVLLFSVGGMFSLYEGLHKLSAPEPLNHPWIAVGVLVFAIIAESASLRAALHEVNKVRGSNSLWHWFRESRQAELVVVFGEDLAALLGLAFALVAVLLTMATGNPLFDAIGTMMIGVLLIVIAIFVAVEVKGLLIGQGVDPALKAQIHTFLAGRAELDEVYNVITLQLGDDVLVSIKAKMAAVPSVPDLIAAINTLERDLRAQFVQVRWSFFEPDDAA